jgi:hypothetical protein
LSEIARYYELSDPLYEEFGWGFFRILTEVQLGRESAGTSRFTECPMTAEWVVLEISGLGDVQTVYANPQKLESLDVSASLSKWITLIWLSGSASGLCRCLRESIRRSMP